MKNTVKTQKKKGNILETSSETEVNVSANLKPHDPWGGEGLHLP